MNYTRVSNLDKMDRSPRDRRASIRAIRSNPPCSATPPANQKKTLVPHGEIKGKGHVYKVEAPYAPASHNGP